MNKKEKKRKEKKINRFVLSGTCIASYMAAFEIKAIVH